MPAATEFKCLTCGEVHDEQERSPTGECPLCTNELTHAERSLLRRLGEIGSNLLGIEQSLDMLAGQYRDSR